MDRRRSLESQVRHRLGAAARRRDRGARAVCSAVSVSVSVSAMACGGVPRPADPPSSTAGVAPETRPCEATVTERGSVRLDGRDVYVEMQAFGPTEDGLLLAGSPVFEWPPGPAGFPELRQNRVLGVLLEGDSVRAIERPPGVGPIRYLRAARDPSGAWVFLMEEVTSEDLRVAAPARVLAAELSDGRWSDLEVLAEHSESPFAFHASSELSPWPTGPEWLLPVERGVMDVSVREYRRVGGRWTSTRLGAALSHTDAVEATQLGGGARPGRWRLLTGQEREPDPDLGYRRAVHLSSADAGTPRGRRIYLAAPGEQIRFPRMSTDGSSLSVAWLSLPRGEPTAAWSAVGIRADGEATATLVDPSAEQIVPVHLADGHTLSIVHHMSPTSADQLLRVYRHASSERAELIGSFPHPYTGYFAATPTGGSELLLVGPEVNPDPAYPSVRSLLLRLSVTCT